MNKQQDGDCYHPLDIEMHYKMLYNRVITTERVLIMFKYGMSVNLNSSTPLAKNSLDP